MVTLRTLLATAATTVILLSSVGGPDARAAAPERTESRAEAIPRAPRAARPSAPAATGPVFTGQAFDACAAPTLALMRAWWRSSPYRAAGIYVGGPDRACAQPQLTRAWVRAVDRIGWRLLPVYVGSQAPCVLGPGPQRLIDPRRTLPQGRAEGADAVRAAAALGLRPGSPLYLDIESYGRRDPACTLAVLRYTTAWTGAVRDRGYVPGFYSSDDSGVADLAAAQAAAQVRHRTRPPRGPRPAGPHGRRTRGAPAGPGLPDAIWYARWNAHPGTADSGALAPGQWAGRRVHQYRGDARETYGGLSQWIDRDSVDAPVAVVR